MDNVMSVRQERRICPTLQLMLLMLLLLLPLLLWSSRFMDTYHNTNTH